MPWTYAEIERDWYTLGLAFGHDQIVAAFDRCERLLGRDWIEGVQPTGKGLARTLNVIGMGAALSSLEGVGRSEHLLDKLRARDPSARAELEAIHLLRSNGCTSVELEPEVNGRRRSDFRIRKEGDWVWVEVARPDVSEAQLRLDRLGLSVCNLACTVPKRFTLEVLLRKEPGEDEYATLLVSIRELLADLPKDKTVINLPRGMGSLVVHPDFTNDFVPTQHTEAVGPTLNYAQLLIGAGQLNRRVSVEMPYIDQRAEALLRSEARQLPQGGPGLVIIDITNAAGAMHWEPAIQRRFQPGLHTRVGAAVLFTRGLRMTDRGLDLWSLIKTIGNPHAEVSLPSWIEETLR